MDWENASGGVYPFGVIAAADPMVKNTVKTVRDYAYQEGIMTYEHNAFKVRQAKEAKGADWSQPEHTVIHHYETFQVLETLLALGMDREVVTDFYSFLVHTGSTHTGFEYDIWAWRDRNFHNNYPPHGWCAARYNECLRNMLVREDPQEPVLHLASALAPDLARSRPPRAGDQGPHRFRRVLLCHRGHRRWREGAPRCAMAQGPRNPCGSISRGLSTCSPPRSMARRWRPRTG